MTLAGKIYISQGNFAKRKALAKILLLITLMKLGPPPPSFTILADDLFLVLRIFQHENRSGSAQK